MWEIIIEEQIFVQKIETTENPVDMLTKVVIVIKFNNYLNLINIVKFDCTIECILTTLQFFNREVSRWDRHIRQCEDFFFVSFAIPHWFKVGFASVP